MCVRVRCLWVIAIIKRNEYDDTSSKPGGGCLHFTEIPLGKV